MRTLPIALAQELASEFHVMGHLIRITLYNTATQTNFPIYLTDMDDDIVCDLGDGAGSKTYLSRGLEFSDGQQSLTPKVDSITFEVDNTSLEFSSYVQNYETRGKECVIYRAAFDRYLQVIGVAVLFPGILDKIEVDHQRARFDVLNGFIRWNTPTPRRKHGVNCFWTYKDPETCRYAGAQPPCDKSWDACAARSNTPNFGGNRWLEFLRDKEIRWGRL